MHEVTRILSAIGQGDPHAAEKLLPLIYGELRRLAAEMMAQEKPGQTLQTTALVHEAYIRLVDVDNSPQWDNRRHFFVAAAEAMRRILVDSARRKQRPKYGGDRQRIDLEAVTPLAEPPDQDLLALDEALAKLAEWDKSSAELVKLRYYGGLSLEQVAELLGMSARTADRRWAYARAWLRQELRRD